MSAASVLGDLGGARERREPGRLADRLVELFGILLPEVRDRCAGLSPAHGVRKKGQAGIVIIAWPGPGVVALAISLGAWLIVIGTLTISGAFAARRVLSDWWLLLITALLEIPLGVLALANPGATLAALITVGGIWAVAIGVMHIVLAFEIKRLPDEVDRAWTARARDGTAATGKPDAARIAAAS